MMITPPSPRYLTILCEFMAFYHEKVKPYPKDHEFSEDELAAITPNDILKWMNVKAFGTPTPTSESKLTGSFSTLEFMKKALSFYMPHKENWDSATTGGSGRGNPTKSREVKALMQRVVALGGGEKKKTRKELEDSGAANAAASQYNNNNNIYGMPSSTAGGDGGPHGLLRRMQAQNNDYITILDTMGMALRTFGRSVQQMKMALETNNIAIRNELSKNYASGDSNNNNNNNSNGYNNGDNNGDDDNDDQDDETLENPTRPSPPNIPAMNLEMKQSTSKFTDIIEHFSTSNVVITPITDIKILSGADGFCTFHSELSGKQTDVPDGFEFPSCDLLRAWRHWIAGFPDFKMRNDNGCNNTNNNNNNNNNGDNDDDDDEGVIDAPIRPLRFVNTSDLPQSLKKKFKDGWRPILLSMQGDVADMLQSTPVSEVDEKFVLETYEIAMKKLLAKAPGICAESGWDRYGSWKVATWSRKIREQCLGQQQVRRRRERDESGGGGSFVVLKTEEERARQRSPSQVEEEGITMLQQSPTKTEEQQAQHHQQSPLRMEEVQTPSETEERQTQEQSPEVDVQFKSRDELGTLI